MDYRINNRDRFDFEIGYLTKSPCLGCKNRPQLPKCHNDCPLLDQIQTTLARGISTQAPGIES